jgi:hypothetical protein
MLAVLSRVLMVLRRGAVVMAGLSAPAMQMPVDVLMGVFVGMDLITVLVFMAVGVGMLMDMEMRMFGDLFHGNLPLGILYSI